MSHDASSRLIQRGSQFIQRESLRTSASDRSFHLLFKQQNIVLNIDLGLFNISEFKDFLSREL